MNERIRELIEKTTTIEYGANNGFDRVTFDKVKFAEMLVEDCIDSLERDRELYANAGMYESEKFYERCRAKEEALADAIRNLRCLFASADE